MQATEPRLRFSCKSQALEEELQELSTGPADSGVAQSIARSVDPAQIGRFIPKVLVFKHFY